MTTAPAVDVRDHVTAFKAALDAPLGRWSAYDYDEVPGSPNNPDELERAKDLPYIYVLVAVERRYAAPRRMTSQVGRSGWRVSFRAVGRTADEARWALWKVFETVDESILILGDLKSTPISFESSTNPELDDGRYSCSAVFTYTV